MDAFFSSKDERQFLNKRKTLFKKIASSEKYSLNSLDRQKIQSFLDINEKSEKVSSFVKELVLTPSSESGDYILEEDEPSALDFLPSSSSILRFFSPDEDDALLSGQHSLAKTLNETEKVAFLRTITSFQKIFPTQLSMQSRVVRHQIKGRVSFLVACTRLYKSPCRSVGLSVCHTLLVRHTLLFLHF